MIKLKYIPILSQDCSQAIPRDKEEVQRRAVNVLRGLGYFFYKARLRAVAIHPEEKNVLGRI